jgi:hypothetical protein
METQQEFFLKQSRFFVYFLIDSHPIALVFHLLFKAAAIVIYLVGSLFLTPGIFTFVILILLLAADFWTVKNVTGRLLVGLRWWNEIREDGSNEWIFESNPVYLFLLIL